MMQARIDPLITPSRSAWNEARLDDVLFGLQQTFPQPVA